MERYSKDNKLENLKSDEAYKILERLIQHLMKNRGISPRAMVQALLNHASNLTAAHFGRPAVLELYEEKRAWAIQMQSCQCVECMLIDLAHEEPANMLKA